MVVYPTFDTSTNYGGYSEAQGRHSCHFDGGRVLCVTLRCPQTWLAGKSLTNGGFHGTIAYNKWGKDSVAIFDF